MILFCIGLAVVYAVAIGANDAANSFGDWVGVIGARTRQVVRGMFLCGLCALLGAILEGHKVSKTIGSGIVPAAYLTIEVVLLGLIGAIFWVFLATYFGLPISTTHSVVGGIAGLGLAIASPINWQILKKIVICWIATPTGAGLIAYTVFLSLVFILKKFQFEKQFSKICKWLIVVTSCYTAYTWGANDVANATALLSASKVVSVKTAVFLGGCGILTGAVLFGSKVAITVGCSITRLTPAMGVCSDIATALTVHFFTQLKIPVSTTHALVGAIIGLGLVRKSQVVNFRIARDIVIAWVITPLVSGIISFFVYKMYLLF
ncbi:MAG: inorganic phosphate transporter [Elusimicrobiota bacterium]